MASVASVCGLSPLWHIGGLSGISGLWSRGGTYDLCGIEEMKFILTSSRLTYSPNGGTSGRKSVRLRKPHAPNWLGIEGKRRLNESCFWGAEAWLKR